MRQLGTELVGHLAAVMGHSGPGVAEPCTLARREYTTGHPTRGAGTSARAAPTGAPGPVAIWSTTKLTPPAWSSTSTSKMWMRRRKRSTSKGRRAYTRRVEEE